MIPSIVEYTNI